MGRRLDNRRGTGSYWEGLSCVSVTQAWRTVHVSVASSMHTRNTSSRFVVLGHPLRHTSGTSALSTYAQLLVDTRYHLATHVVSQFGAKRNAALMTRFDAFDRIRIGDQRFAHQCTRVLTARWLIRGEDGPDRSAVRIMLMIHRQTIQLCRRNLGIVQIGRMAMAHARRRMRHGRDP